MMVFEFSRRAPGLPRLAVILNWVIIASIVGLFFRLVYRARFHGRENVLKRGPLIYIANHQSHYDPPLVGVLVMDRPPTFLARANLFDFKPFGWLIRSLGAVPLEREKGGTGALRTAIKVLQAGRCVLLFPEGTRSRDGAIGAFKSGFALLVKKSGAPVVPIAIEGIHDIWPPSRKYPRLTGLIALKAGKAISAGELLADGPDAAVERMRREIDTMRLELRAELHKRTGGRYPAHGAGDA